MARRYDKPGQSLLDRLADKVLVGDGCWLWTYTKTPEGYGILNVEGKPTHAHRLFYELLVGPISDGCVIDHLCRTPSCVRPAHLEPTSQRENTLRGAGPSAVNAKKTHCLNGHPFDEVNTRLRPDGARECRPCQNIRTRDWKRARRASGGHA